MQHFATAFRKGVIGCLALAVLLTGCNRESKDLQTTSQDPSSAYFQTHFQDESQFIVETILTDLAEMAAFAQSGKLPSEISASANERNDSSFRVPAYEVKLVSGTQVVQKPLKVNQPIWSPELYTDFARSLLANNPPAGHRRDGNDLTVLLALTDPQPSTIETENQRISSLLQTNFNDPTLHEIAAVLLGTFALRELTDDFYDIRSPLCRMTAHLTLARVLSDEAGAGINGRVAEVMLFTLMKQPENCPGKARRPGK